MKVTRRNRYIFPAAAATVVLLSGCETGIDDGTKPIASASSISPTPTEHTGLELVRMLAEKIGVESLGNPADNTSGCASDEEGGCEWLVTTDMASVYEFATPSVAEKWVTTMRTQGDWRQVGKFALAFTARDQAKTSQERRGELESALLDIASNRP